jgi:predicted DNA-binding protein (MmcQ/YjbR family)
MRPQEINDFALTLPEATEEEAFGPGVGVYKVAGKVFAILQPDVPQVTLKCEPGLALELRAQYPAVTAGYHVNKKHWNTVLLDGTVPPDEIHEMVEHAYQQVVKSLPKYVQARLAGRPDDARRNPDRGG